MPRKPKPPKRRPRGQGTVRWVAHLERWEARLPLALGRTASYHATREEATGWLARQIAARAQRDLPPGAEEPLGLYLIRWYRRLEAGAGPATAELARIMIRHAEPIAKTPIGALRYQHVADWAVGLLKGMQASTARNYVGALRRALDDLVPDVLAANPAQRRMPFPRPKPDGDPEHYDELSAARLLRAAWGQPDYPLWEIFLGTGLRLGEALGLTWEQVDLEAGRAEIPHQWDRRQKRKVPTKTRRERTVTLTPRVVRALRGIPEPHQGWLFPGQVPGRPYSHAHIGRMLDRLVERANATGGTPLSRLTPKALRHSFASIALARDVPLTTVAEALGHSNPAVTMRYYAEAIRRRSGDAERALGDALDEVFSTDLTSKNQVKANLP